MSNRPRTQSLPLTAATFGYTDFDNGAKGELVHDTTKFAPCSMIGTQSLPLTAATFGYTDFDN